MFRKLFLVSALAFSSSLLAGDSKHYEAALAVVAIPQDEKLEEMVQTVVEQQVKANPSMRPLRRAFEVFYRETFQSDEFVNGVVEIQMELFSYEELLEIRKMMEIPIYKKYEELMPVILQKNIQLGQEVMVLKQDRLKELVEAEHKRIEQLQELDEQMNLTGSDQ